MRTQTLCVVLLSAAAVPAMAEGGMVSTVGDAANAVLAVCGVILTVAGWLAGTGVGKSHAARTTVDVTKLVQNAARVAVTATEQVKGKNPATTNGAKLADAYERAAGLLEPHGIYPTAGTLTTAIEAAVAEMKAVRAGKG